jgi:hypothetical protein
MHIDILTDRQKELLPYLARFKRSFYLVGGTAISLYLGHRRSIDFDLFSYSRLPKRDIWRKLDAIPYQKKRIAEDTDQLHLYINEIKVTFFNYPYQIERPVSLNKFINMPTLLSLAAMKAFALGRRAKWKDYVDLYYLVINHFSILEISEEAKRLYNDLFHDKLFREQLAFHKDIDFSEQVEYMPGFEVEDEVIKTFLIDKALEW